jgi:hypothetical protein
MSTAGKTYAQAPRESRGDRETIVEREAGRGGRCGLG